jgi:AGZA family xanthine/uracil permease-like MFS transporter
LIPADGDEGVVQLAQTSQGQTVRVPDAPGGGGGGLDRYFQISARGSTVRTELLAGLTTFLTMAYILFVNPAILGLGGAGLGFAQVLTVTALAAGVMTILMGVVGKYPFAIAAGLGLNAFVAFTLVGANGLSFPQAMGVIVVEGLVITVLVLTNIREMVVNAIPMDLKRAIGIGIGMFIAFIGLVEAGIVHGVSPTAPPSPPPVGLGDLTTWGVVVFAFGLIVSGTLIARKIRGALLIGIVASTILAIVINAIASTDIWTNGIASIPSKVVQTPDFALVGNFSFSFWSALGWATAIAVIVSVMLSDFFDTVGTVIGIADEADMLDDQGRLPGMKRVLLVDSLAAAFGGFTSASSNTTFIESASGVSDGGRTGLASVMTGALFLLAMFFSPIAGVIPPEATAPALVIVGYFMMSTAAEIDWKDPGIGIPVLLTVIVMPFTYSITNGVGAGFLAYVAIAVLRGKAREVHPLLYVVAAIFAWYFVHGVV